LNSVSLLRPRSTTPTARTAPVHGRPWWPCPSLSPPLPLPCKLLPSLPTWPRAPPRPRKPPLPITGSDPLLPSNSRSAPSSLLLLCRASLSTN
jgi:hypothetical protein